MSIESLIGDNGIIPVLVYRSVEEAVATSRVLVDAGIRLHEITLRTPVALDCISAVAREVPRAVVGAGTVLSPADLEAAIGAGARFGISPGLTPQLADAVTAHAFPFVPGAATVSEMLAARDRGFRVLKFFPAGPLGGPSYLRSLLEVLPDIRFCATGGITAANATDYLVLPNVCAIGGSWIVQRDAVDRVDLESTRQGARACVELASRFRSLRGAPDFAR